MGGGLCLIGGDLRHRAVTITARTFAPHHKINTAVRSGAGVDVPAAIGYNKMMPVKNFPAC